MLLIDEIDALIGQSLIDVLSQLRSGYPDRPRGFPWSVVLCGMRDVTDYKAASGGDPDRLESPSPFNIMVDSFRIGDFTRDEIAALYAQHTADTGQEFTPDGVDYAFEVTRGQPWLVNSLAREVIVKMRVPVTEAIGPRRLETAKERLIRAHATHLGSLAARLNEDRVRRIIAPLIIGEQTDDPELDETYNDDLKYARDLGLVAQDRPLRVANPIYRDVIPRVLGARTENEITTDPQTFVRPDGTLDFTKLLTEFANFWKANGEVLTRRDAYHEAAPQLVLMAYLHRLVNGGGFIDREYGVGRGRIDLLIRWPYASPDGKPHMATTRARAEGLVRQEGRPTREGPRPTRRIPRPRRARHRSPDRLRPAD